jgi:hypothetical protein
VTDEMRAVAHHVAHVVRVDLEVLPTDAWAVAEPPAVHEQQLIFLSEWILFLLGQLGTEHVTMHEHDPRPRPPLDDLDFHQLPSPCVAPLATHHSPSEIPWPAPRLLRRN